MTFIMNNKPGHLLDDPAHLVELYEHGGWGAVYVNGQLVDGPGDIGNRYEFLLHGFAVNHILDGAAFKDPNGEDVPALTTADIKHRIAMRDLAKQTASSLREKAAKLLAEADELDPQR